MPELGGLVAWSSTGVFVTEGLEDSGMIDIRDDETGQSVISFEAHDGDVNDVAFSRGRIDARPTGDDGKLKVSEPLDRSASRQRLGGRRGMRVCGPSFSEDGLLVAAAGGLV